eukprot:8813304-Pyramimonas_sp.AAC.1
MMLMMMRRMRRMMMMMTLVMMTMTMMVVTVMMGHLLFGCPCIHLCTDDGFTMRTSTLYKVTVAMAVTITMTV